MNKIIDQKTFDLLFFSSWYLVGSSLYKDDPKDRDLVCVSQRDLFDNNSVYQYKDQNLDYIIVHISKFINAGVDGSDIILYEAKPEVVNFRIVKAYIGLAERDLKQYLKTDDESKLFHSLRCVFNAISLMNYDNKSKIKHILIKNAKFVNDNFEQLKREDVDFLGQLIKQSKKENLLKELRNEY